LERQDFNRSKAVRSRTKLILRAYKTELKLNNQQRTHCRKHAGCAHFAFNWGLHRKIEAYQQTGKMPTAIDLHRELVRLKRSQFSWMYEVSKCAPQEALRNLDQAFRNFFRRLKTCKPPGFPKFKTRKRSKRSFRLTGTIHVFPDAIQLPRLGRLRLKERNYLPKESDHVRILSATVSEKAGRWFVSLLVEEARTIPKNFGPVVGVDLGINRLATISNGITYDNPRALKRFERKLKRLQRMLSRRENGSQNYQKTLHHLQNVHSRILNKRLDTLHQISSKLAKTKSVIVVEDLDVERLKRNHRMAKSISDCGFSEFRRQLKYKTLWYGSNLLVAPRFFPSSKRCSRCGHIKTRMKLSIRVYRCKVCKLIIDRDLNASQNLSQVAASWAETQNACFEVGGYSLSKAVPTNDAGTDHHWNDIPDG
jgi:putative transposase